MLAIVFHGGVKEATPSVSILSDHTQHDTVGPQRFGLHVSKSPAAICDRNDVHCSVCG